MDNPITISAIIHVLSQDTPRFCRSTLASPEFIRRVDEEFILWGGSVDCAEPWVLSRDHLKPAAFPFMAVLLCKPGGESVLVDKLEGEHVVHCFKNNKLEICQKLDRGCPPSLNNAATSEVAKYKVWRLNRP